MLSGVAGCIQVLLLVLHDGASVGLFRTGRANFNARNKKEFRAPSVTCISSQGLADSTILSMDKPVSKLDP